MIFLHLRRRFYKMLRDELWQTRQLRSSKTMLDERREEIYLVRWILFWIKELYNIFGSLGHCRASLSFIFFSFLQHLPRLDYAQVSVHVLYVLDDRSTRILQVSMRANRHYETIERELTKGQPAFPRCIKECCFLFSLSEKLPLITLGAKRDTISEGNVGR